MNRKFCIPADMKKQNLKGQISPYLINPISLSLVFNPVNLFIQCSKLVKDQSQWIYLGTLFCID